MHAERQPALQQCYFGSTPNSDLLELPSGLHGKRTSDRFWSLLVKFFNSNFKALLALIEFDLILHTHTHTHIYTYSIYIYSEPQRGVSWTYLTCLVHCLTAFFVDTSHTTIIAISFHYLYNSYYVDGNKMCHWGEMEPNDLVYTYSTLFFNI